MADVRSVIEQVVGRTTGQGFTLKDLDDFPHSEYSQRLTLYEELGKWFTGEMLVDYVKVGKKKIDKYPIRLNPIYGACLKHAYALFGEFPDDIDGSLIQPRVKNAELLTDERTKVAQQALINMWSENNGAALQIEAGISSPGSKALEAAALESESYSEMKIRNHGSVIKDMDLQRIFSLFFTAKDYGPGIGLTVSKKIVEAHNGSISVHSDNGGTTFTVWLPLNQQAPPIKQSA